MSQLLLANVQREGVRCELLKDTYTQTFRKKHETKLQELWRISPIKCLQPSLQQKEKNRKTFHLCLTLSPPKYFQQTTRRKVQCLSYTDKYINVSLICDLFTWMMNEDLITGLKMFYLPSTVFLFLYFLSFMDSKILVKLLWQKALTYIKICSNRIITSQP